MTTKELEELEIVLVATMLAHPLDKPGPNVCSALAYAEWWEFPIAGRVAAGIGKALAEGRPTHPKVVECFVERGYKHHVTEPLFGPKWEGVWDQVESDALFMVAHYHNKRIVGILCDSYFRANAHPDKAHDTARNLIVELEGVLR